MNYVSDIVEGMITAGFEPKTVGETMNLASGKDFSIEEIVNMIGDILGKKLIIKTEKKRLRPEKSEVQRLVGDNRLAERKIGYIPQVSIKSGLEKTIRFFEKNLALFPKEDYQL